MVQHFTMLTVRELREALGMSQRKFASTLGCSRRSIISWEQGALPLPVYTMRMQTLARRHGLSNPVGRGTFRYRPDLAAKYLGKPGSTWKHMRYHERANWWNQRKRYQRIIAEEQSGCGSIDAHTRL